MKDELSITKTTGSVGMDLYQVKITTKDSLYSVISGFSGPGGIVAYKSYFKADTHELVVDFNPQNLSKCKVARPTKPHTDTVYLIYVSFKKGSKNAQLWKKLTPCHVPLTQYFLTNNKLKIQMLVGNKTSKPKKQNKPAKHVSSDIESQCHKLLQVLPDVLIKKMFSSDDLATKFANTVDYRTSRDLKALEKTLLEEMAKQQEQTEKKLSGQLTAGINEIKDQLTDWLNH